VIPNREGLFNAYPAEVGVDETGPNKLATCIIKFKLHQELQASGEWDDCAAENFEITGYFYLEKKDGSLNTITVDALKAALGWDGRDPFWLQETDLSQHPVQLKLAFEEYNGKTRLKVQYLNPFGSTGTGGITKADGAAKTAIRNRLGSKLRALAGPAQKPAPPAAPPNLPPAKPKAPPAPAPTTVPAPTASPAPECTMGEAWGEFIKHCDGEKWTQDAVETEWFRVLSEVFPGKQPDQLSSSEWGVMRDEAPAKIIPF
jgi:hypothetical protein